MKPVVLVLGCLMVLGCGNSPPQEPDLIFGKRGLRPGDFIRPRAITVGTTPAGEEELYVVDFEGRIQVFNSEGSVRRHWRTPVIDNGRPAGLCWSKKTGNLIVADSHYQQLLIYDHNGSLLRTIPGTLGDGNLGPFQYVADVAEDAAGNLYVSEFGNEDQSRIRKLRPDGSHIKSWGSHGSKPGEFLRPRGLAINSSGELYVADSSNHRIQVFNLEGELLRWFGGVGTGEDQLQYPYDIVLGAKDTVYVAEYGNNRIHKFTRDGNSLGTWGTAGRGPGLLNQPWGVTLDSSGRLYVLDSYNHRVQRLTW